MSDTPTIAPALTAEEWAAVLSGAHASNDVEIQRPDEQGNPVFIASCHWAASETRHFIAAQALHGQPYGFTREDLRWLSLCADNAERYASRKMHDTDDHKAHEHTRTIAQRIAALLPPETK